MIPALAAAVRARSFPAADRIGLLSDQAALCKGGMLAPAQ